MTELRLRDAPVWANRQIQTTDAQKHGRTATDGQRDGAPPDSRQTETEADKRTDRQTDRPILKTFPAHSGRTGPRRRLVSSKQI